MKKIAPLLVLLLVAIVGAFLLLSSGPKQGLRPDDLSDEGPAPESGRPTALSAPPPGSALRHEKTRIVDEPLPEQEKPGEGPAITGFVVDAETGKPIAGASIATETSDEPCPRALQRPHPFLDGDAGTIKGSDGRLYTSRGRLLGSTDQEGAFRVAWEEPGAADVFVKARGYVLGCWCRATMAAPATVRLDRGLSIEGVVVSRDDKPIAGARVWTASSSKTTTGIGHDEVATTNAEGKFAISGLVAGTVIVRADLSPNWMPAASEPMEPGRRDVRLVLVPAFIVTFEFKTDDGREPETPTVAWTTTGNPPRSGLQLLQATVSHPASSQDGGLVFSAEPFEPVRLPADRPSVRFEVKALGYSTWASEFVEIPAAGGATTIAVELKRDPNLGQLIVHFEDRDGKVLSYVKEQIDPAIWRRDGQAVSAGIVLKPAETLEVPALSSGPYGLLFRSPGHAPLLLEKVDVAAGRDTEVRAILGVPAKVHVHFTAPERLTVRFRVMQGRELALVWPELVPNALLGAKSSTEDGTLDAAPEGIVLTGLGTGRYTIEVMSPELTAAPTAVDLVEGDTKEVEISVSKK